MRPKIDQEKCISCGTCVSLCPKVFKLGDSGKAEVISEDYADCDLNTVVSSCPVSAISLE